jgi:hypothetical protein
MLFFKLPTTIKMTGQYLVECYKPEHTTLYDWAYNKTESYTAIIPVPDKAIVYGVYDCLEILLIQASSKIITNHGITFMYTPNCVLDSLTSIAKITRH